MKNECQCCGIAGAEGNRVSNFFVAVNDDCSLVWPITLRYTLNCILIHKSEESDATLWSWHLILKRNPISAIPKVLRRILTIGLSDSRIGSVKNCVWLDFRSKKCINVACQWWEAGRYAPTSASLKSDILFSWRVVNMMIRHSDSGLLSTWAALPYLGCFLAGMLSPPSTGGSER